MEYPEFQILLQVFLVISLSGRFATNYFVTVHTDIQNYSCCWSAPLRAVILLSYFPGWSLYSELFINFCRMVGYPLNSFAARPELFPVAGFKSRFCRGNKNSFLSWVTISFVDAFRGIRIATDWNSILCYVTISYATRMRYFSTCCYTNESK